MKRSMQEIVELLVFALIALLIGTGLVWVVGWLMSLVGFVFQWLAGLVWSLLRFAVPVAIVAAAVYALVKLLQRQESRVSEGVDNSPKTGPSSTGATSDASPAASAPSTSADTPAASEGAAAGGAGEEARAADMTPRGAAHGEVSDVVTDADRQVSGAGTEVSGASPSPGDDRAAEDAATGTEPLDEAAARRNEGGDRRAGDETFQRGTVPGERGDRGTADDAARDGDAPTEGDAGDDDDERRQP